MSRWSQGHEGPFGNGGHLVAAIADRFEQEDLERAEWLERVGARKRGERYPCPACGKDGRHDKGCEYLAVPRHLRRRGRPRKVRGLCTVPGCDRPEKQGGLCSGHRAQAQGGKPFGPLRKYQRRG